MIQLIVGEKGKGKTKVLLDKANTEIKEANGSFVYLDKSTKHMYELNNKVRLIDVSSFDVASTGEFIGFVLGILSQDNDLEKMYLDSFLKIAAVDEADVNAAFDKLDAISKKFSVDFVISVSVTESAVAEQYKANIVAAL